ncbi:helix-turn-helix domain-containing protein [Nocardia sp. NPDC050175]|uniref:helix-turn-helix domain-containing protein n=1 Tax=Nocardia sp. NPDC050175 TaxID=3364317 RepID=UPI003790BCC0
MGETIIRDDRAVLSISSSEVEQARVFKARVDQVQHAAADADAAGVLIGLRGGDTVEMPAELSSLIGQVLDLVSRGCTVTVASVPNELTTTTAAKILGMSRPTLMKLVKEGAIPAHKVRSHTRLLSKDVFAFKEQQSAEQRHAFDELRQLEDDLGLVD